MSPKKWILGLLASSLLLVSSAVAQSITIKISTASVPDDWHTRALTVFKNYVEQADPRIKVEVYPSSQLFKQDAELAAQQRGNLDMAYTSAQTLATLLPDVTPLTAGYVIQNPLHLCSTWSGDLGKEWRKLISDKVGLTVLDILYLGTRQLTLRTDKTIRTPADLAGVKLRMPNSPAWLFLGQALGANPTPLAFSEVYLALQTGTIDGQDNPLPSVKSAKFYEVSKQVVLTGHLVDGILLTIANSTWNKLSNRQKTILQEGARSAALFNNKNRIAEEADIVDFFKQEGLKVSTPDKKAFRDTVLAAYRTSDFAKQWPAGILDKIQTYNTRVATDCYSYFR